MRKPTLGWLLVLVAAVLVSPGCNGDGAVLISIPNFDLVASQLNANGAGTSGAVEICCDGLNVYVAWVDDRDGLNDVYFNYSSDGGVTWQLTDTRLDTDVAGAGSSNDPRICCDGQRIYVVWRDARNGSDDIYANSSADGGVTWQVSDSRLDTDTPGAANSNRPVICCSGLNVYVAWEDNRDGGGDVNVYFNSSSDGGATWQVSDIRIDTDAVSTGTGRFTETISICCSGLNVYVAWEDHRNGNGDVYFNYSSDGGVTWQVIDIRIDTGTTPGTTTADRPQICCDGLRVYIAWRDNRNEGPPPPNRDIIMNYSFDGGATWQLNPIVVDRGNLDSNQPRICCDGLNVYVIWRDNRNGADDIYFNYSRNGGATWQPGDTRLDTGDGPGVSDSDKYRICCSGSRIFVVWEDLRNGLEDIYLNYSTNGGVTWLGTDIRIDGGDVLGSTQSDDPHICCEGEYVYIVWDDDRNAQQDIFFNGSTP